MKIILVLNLILSTFVTFSQNLTSISAGIKLTNNETSNVIFGYVDESPSMDNISTAVEQKGKIAVMANVRFQDNYEKDLHYFIEGQGYLGSVNGLALNLGLLYLKSGESSTKVQPELGLVVGYSTKYIGEIENNDVYIQVNDTKFKDYTNVDVRLNNIYYGLKPGLSFLFDAGETSKFGVGINYLLSIKTGSVSFSGVNSSDEEISDQESLNESNVSFYVDGEKTDKVPYNADGLEFKLIYQF